MKNKILILGMGSSIRGDDGVGLYVARKLKDRLMHPSIDIIATEETGFKFLDLLMNYQRLIVIDSINNGNVKSDILRLTQKYFRLKSQRVCSHQMGIFNLIKIGKRLGLSMPSEVIVYAIPIRRQDRFNLKVSKRLKRIIPKLMRLIKMELSHECEKKRSFSGG